MAHYWNGEVAGVAKGPAPKTLGADGKPEGEHDMSDGPAPETQEATMRSSSGLRRTVWFASPSRS